MNRINGTPVTDRIASELLAGAMSRSELETILEELARGKVSEKSIKAAERAQEIASCRLKESPGLTPAANALSMAIYETNGSNVDSTSVEGTYATNLLEELRRKS